MIEFQNGRYVNSDFVLAIDLKIDAGDICAVLGPSGAGKSTLLSIIAGFETLASGTLLLHGRAPESAPSQRPVSMVFQDHNVFAHLDVWSNVALGTSSSLRLNERQKVAVDAALNRVGLSIYKSRKPGDISGGERQRIALARVLVRDKPILLLDEPFASLDPGLRLDMLQLVSDIQKERKLTVLLVTHQPQEALRVAEKIIFVNQGDINTVQSCAEFFASNDPRIRVYLGI